MTIELTGRECMAGAAVVGVAAVVPTAAIGQTTNPLAKMSFREIIEARLHGATGGACGAWEEWHCFCIGGPDCELSKLRTLHPNRSLNDVFVMFIDRHLDSDTYMYKSFRAALGDGLMKWNRTWLSPHPFNPTHRTWADIDSGKSVIHTVQGSWVLDVPRGDTMYISVNIHIECFPRHVT